MQWDTKGGVGQFAEIAVIARHSRNRRGRILPLIHTDERSKRPNLTTDKHGWHGSGRIGKPRKPYRSRCRLHQSKWKSRV